MFSRKSTLFASACAALLALVSITRVAAQTEADPVAVPVDFQGRALTDGDAEMRWLARFSVSFDASTQTSLSSYGSFAWSTTSTTTNTTVSPAQTTSYATAMMKPGKDYYFSIGLTRILAYEVHFDAPQGMRVFINDVDSRMFTAGDQSGSGNDITGPTSIKVRIENAEVTPSGQASSLRPGRVIWNVGMGQLMNGRSAGAIELRENGLSASSFTPSALIYDTDSNEVQRVMSGGVLRQVYADQCLADITADNDHAFRIKFYTRAQVTGQDSTTSLFTTDGTSPLYEYIIENPDYPTVDKLRISRITRQNGADYTTWTELQQQSTTQFKVLEWSDTAVASSGANYTNWTYANNNADETIETYDAGGNLATRTVNHYTAYAWGSELTETTAGDQLSNPVTTSYDYYTDPSAPGNYKKLKSVVYSGGGWIKYDYYDDLARRGQINHIYKPFGDYPSSPAGASTSSGEVTTMDYAADWIGDQRRPSSVQTSVNNVLTAQSTISYDETQSVDGMPIVVTTRSDSANASQTLTTVIKTFREDADSGRHFYPGLTHSVKRPDGTMDVNIFLRGYFMPGTRDFSPSAAGSEWDSMSLHGTSVSSPDAIALTSWNAGDQTPSLEPDFLVVPYKTTAADVVHASDSTPVLAISKVCGASGSFEVLVRDMTAYDSHFVFPSSTTRDSGDTTHTWYVMNNSWTQGRLVSATDENRIVQQYTYDSSGRIYTQTQTAAGSISAIQKTFTYDAAGHVTSEVLGSNAPANKQLTTTRHYDQAGRVTDETAPGNGTTTYTYDPSTRSVTVTLPTGSSSTQQLYLDGQIKQVTGSAVVAKYYTYDVRSTDGYHYARVNVSTSGDARKIETWSDWLGRPATVRHPGFNGGTPFDETYSYDSVGRLQEKTPSGYAATLYGYDNLSRVIQSGLDLDASGTLDPASTDRLSDFSQVFQKDGNGAWWSVETVTAYPYSNGNPQTVSTTKTRLTGLSDTLRGEIHSIDANNVDTARTLTLASSSPTATATTTRTGYSGSQTEVAVNGFGTSVTRFDGLQYTTAYDEIGRVYQTTDPRTGATTTNYYDNTAKVSEVDEPGGRLSKFGYDSAGRLSWKQWGPSGSAQVTNFTYTARSEVYQQWGSEYPVQYGYSAYGERTSLSTWQNTIDWTQANWGTPTSTTTWTFDPGSGLLQKKTDASGQFVEYDYNARGQTAHRYWARTLPNSTTRVTTAYAYFGDNTGEPQTGELREVSYNDGITAAVDYTYTRLGQVSTVNDHVTDPRTFNYDATNNQMLRLASLQLGGFYGNRIITPQYDGIYRNAGVYVGNSGNTSADVAQVYGYTGAGRFDHIDSTNTVQATRRFTYGYKLANSPLVSQLTSGAFTVNRDYDPNRDLLTWIDSQWNTASQTRYDYTYNTLDQRATTKQSGSAFDDFGSTYYRYVYNNRGELADGAGYVGTDTTSTALPLPGRHFAYTYDNIGNRLTDSRTGATPANASSTNVLNKYTPNTLNQYSNRENNVVDVAGTVAGNSSISVSGGSLVSSVGTQGQYWDAQIIPSNTGGPAKTTVTVSATLSGAVRSDQRTAYIAQALQSFSYDADGNLTGDGVWNYTYDAENRLISMTTTTLAANAGIPNRLLDFKYDYVGRRVQKHSQNITAGTETWRRYLYDGNNLIAEFDAPSGSSCGNTLRSYTWGLDLAGSLTATGGVGALVQITDHTTSTSYFPTYDGNGNVASLINAATGALAATYEYSPFGELLRAEGSYAASNSFRFSTKFTDDETGLVYYGGRYYSPSLGRFINRDPIAEAGGLNLYGFCGNDGIDHFDIMGNGWWKKLKHSLSSFWDSTVLSFGKHVAQNWDHGRPYITAAAAIVAAFYVGPLVSSWVSTAITADEIGISYGAASSLITGGTIGLSNTAIVAGAAAGGFAGGSLAAGIQGANLNQSLESGLFAAAAAGAIAAYAPSTFENGFQSPASDVAKAYDQGGALRAAAAAGTQLEHSAVTYGFQRLGMSAAHSMGLSYGEFVGGLYGLSFAGEYLVGSRVYGPTDPDNSAIGTWAQATDLRAIRGIFSRQDGPLRLHGWGAYAASAVADAADIALNWQGFPTAAGVRYLHRFGSTAVTGESNGAMDVANLRALGLVQPDSVVRSLPFGSVGTGGLWGAINYGDFVSGFGLTKVLNPWIDAQWNGWFTHMPWNNANLPVAPSP